MAIVPCEPEYTLMHYWNLKMENCNKNGGLLMSQLDAKYGSITFFSVALQPKWGLGRPFLKFLDHAQLDKHTR
jgi:hypothetical protein